MNPTNYVYMNFATFSFTILNLYLWRYSIDFIVKHTRNMSDSPKVDHNLPLNTELVYRDVNATQVPISDLGKSDQVVTPTSLEKIDFCSSSSPSAKRGLTSIEREIETFLKKMKSIKEFQVREQRPAANAKLMIDKRKEKNSLDGIYKYLESREIDINEHSIWGYRELEDVKASAQAQIDRLKELPTFQEIDNFDWSKVEHSYAFIFKDYILVMETIFADLDQSMKVNIP